MNGQDGTPNKSTLTSKKRDASSPLQESSLELKKSKLLKSPLAHTAHTEGDCSNIDIDIDSDAGQEYNMMSAKGGEPVLTERDLDNIVDKMQKVFVPLVTKMIDASMRDLKKEYDDKVDNHKQLISDLAEVNDDLRSEVSSLQLEIERLKSRDDELEQYSRRNSLRISGVKEGDKRPTTEIVLEIALKMILM